MADIATFRSLYKGFCKILTQAAQMTLCHVLAEW